jgi:GrpB-like predicted nucleotidyltransferase (UPF0157 family)
VAIFTATAVIVSFYAYYHSMSEQAYADLDTLCLEVLKIGLAYPKFRNPELTKDYKNAFNNSDELFRYETYAYIAWNIAETMFDRQNKRVFETWEPAIDFENTLHRSWFDNPENHYKFKQRFRDYIRANFPASVEKNSNQTHPVRK